MLLARPMTFILISGALLGATCVLPRKRRSADTAEQGGVRGVATLCSGFHTCPVSTRRGQPVHGDGSGRGRRGQVAVGQHAAVAPGRARHEVTGRAPRAQRRRLEGVVAAVWRQGQLRPGCRGRAQGVVLLGRGAGEGRGEGRSRGLWAARAHSLGPCHSGHSPLS